MNISASESAISISGPADLRDCAALKAALIDGLDARRATVLDLSGLERADAALLQLLCSAIRTFAAEGVSLTAQSEDLEGAGSVLSRAWAAAGFACHEPEAPQ